MLKPPIDELIEKAGSRYSLVIAASKRARQIIDGAEKLIETDSIKPVSIATLEIHNELIECIEPTDEEIKRVEAAEAALLTGTSTEEEL